MWFQTQNSISILLIKSKDTTKAHGHLILYHPTLKIQERWVDKEIKKFKQKNPNKSESCNHTLKFSFSPKKIQKPKADRHMINLWQEKKKTN